MPQFRIKNLMIDVVSGAKVPDLEKLCRWPTRQCEGGILTKCFFHSGQPCVVPTCRVPSVDCGPCSVFPSIPCEPNCSRLSPIIEECEVPSLIPCAAGSELLVIDLRKLVVNPELVQQVRTELEQVLQVAAERGAEIGQAMTPQTKAQADMLAGALEDALKEVQRLRDTLK